MTTQPFIIGRMSDPVQAHVLHISVLDPLQVNLFLREQIAHGVVKIDDNVVLIADAHHNARPPALRLLRKAISLAGVNIRGVFGDHAQAWATGLETTLLTDKPRVAMDMAAARRRSVVLAEMDKATSEAEDLKVVNELVEQSLERVNSAEDATRSGVELLSFEDRQRQKKLENQRQAEANRIAKLREEEQQRLETIEQVQNDLRAQQEQAQQRKREEEEATQRRLQEEQDRQEELKRLQERLDELQTGANAVAQELNQATASHRQIEETLTILEAQAETLPVEEVASSVELPADEAVTARAEEEHANAVEDTWGNGLEVQAQFESTVGQLPIAQLKVAESTPAQASMRPPLRVKGRVRAGCTLQHNGDVIVEGSVHPQAEVVACGDIHVYGTGGGRLLAGVSGNHNACIYVHMFDAEIVSIAGHYHIIEDINNHWSGRSIKISLVDGVLHFEEIRLIPQRAA